MLTVGQKVTPKEKNINWTHSLTLINSPGPKYGDVLIIRHIILARGCFGNLITALVFDEYPGDAYDQEEFRPVVETDISIFNAMLNKKDIEELV